MQTEITNSQYGLSNFWSQGDAISHVVVLILLLMSTLSWMQIALKAWRVWHRSLISKALEGFWHESSLEKAIKKLSDQLGSAHNFSELATSAVQAAHHFDNQKNNEIGKRLDRDDFITRALRQTINRATAKLESGMTILASIGAVSPFVGLFGTVYGIYNALLGISAAGSATLNTVSGPVGEALIMTALGLLVAIPAVLAYNAFSRFNRLELMELDGFAHDLHSYLTTGGRLK
ncbi:MAG: MotA/TolQ/ExbB proton channel family protein [Rickettsiales bacterium]|nr:MotA/TolQ/ExbB proton channel family protein [Rickettsiales bacterium]